jgi:hypothetical protein
MMPNMSEANSYQSTSAPTDFTDEQRLLAVRWVVSAGFLAGFAFAPRLWISSRAYPLIPIVPLPTVPVPVDFVSAGVLIGLLLIASVFYRQRWPLLAFVGLLIFLVLGDQVRLQPWVYLYGFLLLALGVIRDDRQALNIVRLVIVATYFWSGLHKLNWTFIHESMALLLSGIVPGATARYWGPVLGWPAPFVEASAAVGLLLGPVRPYAVAVLLAMHAFILLALGPVGLNINSVIWPWNITMSLLLLVLFARTPSIPWRAVLLPGRSAMHGAAIVLFGLLPFLHCFGLWDMYLSSSLYSGMHAEAGIVMSEAVAQKLPSEVQSQLIPDSGALVLSLVLYPVGELNVPPYPEPRYYRAMARRIWVTAGQPNDMFLLLVERPSVWTGELRRSLVRCRDLE